MRALMIAAFAWLHRRVLALYPVRFRARFSGPMNAAMVDALVAAGRDRGAPGVVVDGIRAVADALRGVAPARASVARDRLLWPPAVRAPLSRRAGLVTDSLVADGRLAFRSLRRTPVFAASMIAALALGLGATTAMYAVVRGVLWEPLPYREPDRLVMIWSDNAREQRPRNPISAADFRDLTQGARSLAGAEALFSFLLPIRVSAETGIEIAQASVVTPGMFTLLGRAALVGRTFTTTDTRGVVVISHQYWRRHFGGDPAVVGRTLPVLDQVNAAATPAPPEPLRVIGVMPPDFAFPYRTMLGPTGVTRAAEVDVWLPLTFEGPRLADGGGYVRHVRLLGAVGRLAPGATIDAARAELSARAAQLAHAWPSTNLGWGTTVVPLHVQTVGAVEPMLAVVFVGMLVLLAMACVNLANLLLARGISRAGDAAVRAALGAERGRLVQQALVESLVLGLAGGIAALLVGHWGLAALRALIPPGLPRLQSITMDSGVVVFTLAAAAAAALAIGAASSLAAVGFALPTALRGTGRGAIGGAGQRGIRTALVVTEIALAVVLTVGAGLLGRSFVSLLDVDPGFTPESVLTLQLNIPDALDTTPKRLAYYDTLFERLQSMPGVRAVGGTTRLPLGSPGVTTEITIEGRDSPGQPRREAEFRRAMHDFFAAMEIPLLEGRLFTRDDGPATPPVAIVNRTLARRLFGPASPVGHRVRIGTIYGAGPWLTIVGVVGDIRHVGLEFEPAAEIYVTHRQGPPVSPFLAIRVAGDPASIAPAVRAAVLGVARGAAVFDIRTMLQVRAASVAQRRFAVTTAAIFGGVALVLAGLGVYGVMALSVAERTSEIGVRLALGGRPIEIFALVLRQSWRLAAVGIGLGLALAALLAPALRAQLYGVPPLDAATFAGVALVLFAVAGLAAVLPARGAMRIDPVAAMRTDRA
jgi:putative ABC transport system permease protein